MADDIHGEAAMICHSCEVDDNQASERRLLLGALGEAEQSAKRKAQRCFAPKGVYTTLRVDEKTKTPSCEARCFIVFSGKCTSQYPYRRYGFWKYRLQP